MKIHIFPKAIDLAQMLYLEHSELDYQVRNHGQRRFNSGHVVIIWLSVHVFLEITILINLELYGLCDGISTQVMFFYETKLINVFY